MKFNTRSVRRRRAGLTLGLAGLLALAPLMPEGVFLQALAGTAAPWSASSVPISAEAAESAAEKMRRIEEASNSGTAGYRTAFSEEEVNSYLAYEMAPRYPRGLSTVDVRFLPGRIAGTAEVDFDQAKADRPGGGMADYLFRGQHTLAVEGAFSAVDGVGHFDLESVALDGVTVPRTMVDLLIDVFLKPRYPDLALDAPFLLPESIDRVQVMRGSILVEVNPPAGY